MPPEIDTPANLHLAGFTTRVSSSPRITVETIRHDFIAALNCAEATARIRLLMLGLAASVVEERQIDPLPTAQQMPLIDDRYFAWSINPYAPDHLLVVTSEAHPVASAMQNLGYMSDISLDGTQDLQVSELRRGIWMAGGRTMYRVNLPQFPASYLSASLDDLVVEEQGCLKRELAACLTAYLRHGRDEGDSLVDWILAEVKTQQDSVLLTKSLWVDLASTQLPNVTLDHLRGQAEYRVPSGVMAELGALAVDAEGRA